MPENDAPQMTEEQQQIFGLIMHMVGTDDDAGFCDLIRGLGDDSGEYITSLKVWRDFFNKPTVAELLDGK